jgi:anti-sigma-K factor RskA
MSEQDDMLAAELVMGLLAPDARREAERREGADAAFARRVAYWRGRFADFDATAEPVAPSGDLWSAIERDVRGAAPSADASRPGLVHRLWNSLPVLRLATAVSALAAVLALGWAFTALEKAQTLAARKPVYVAILVSDTTREAGAVVNAYAGGKIEMIPLTDINVPEGRVLEIWTLWDRAVGPRSVGLLPRAQAMQLKVEQLPPPTPGQLFEITLEPAGGSPTGRPTGPILYKGTASRAL